MSIELRSLGLPFLDLVRDEQGKRDREKRKNVMIGKIKKKRKQQKKERRGKNSFNRKEKGRKVKR